MKALETIVDTLYNLKSYKRPESLHQPLIIAHRGAWNFSIEENSLQAFKRAQDLGAGGIEFDVHFTRDDVPVIHHDPDLQRIHGCPNVIRESTVAELRTRVPDFLSLEQVLELKGLHFMIELKCALTRRQQSILESHLSQHEAQNQYHLLTLNPEFCFASSAIPKEAWCLVAEFNVNQLVQKCLREGFGGVAGHYMLISQPTLESLHKAQKKVGVGFTPTANLMYREWERGVDWIFTNHAAEVLAIRNENSQTI